MRDIAAELKELRLHGMAGAWADLTSQKGMPAAIAADLAGLHKRCCGWIW